LSSGKLSARWAIRLPHSMQGTGGRRTDLGL